MSVVCTVATASPVAKAVQIALTKAGVEVAEAAKFSVTTAGRTFVGIAPIVTVVGATSKNTAIFGATAAQRAAVSQWTGLATHIAADAADPADVEALLPLREGFLADTPTASFADIVMYAVAAEQVLAAPKRFPKMHKWALRAGKDDLVAGIKVEAEQGASPAAAAAAAAPGKAAKGGKDKPVFAKPTAEEIFARRAEKEKAKAEKEKERAAKGEAEPAKPVGPQSTDIDLRVGVIVDIKKHDSAERLFVESIDLGEECPRTIVSGLVAHYAAEELKGQKVVVVCNMKPRALQGIQSHGMVLCACSETATKVIQPVADVPVGSRVSIGGELAPALAPVNKKIMDLLAPMRTDASGKVMWGDAALAVGDAAVSAPLCDVVVK